MPDAIEAKIISEIPLPTPRWVISSPSHISSVQPAVSEITMMKTFENVSVPTTLSPAAFWKLRKRKT